MASNVEADETDKWTENLTFRNMKKPILILLPYILVGPHVRSNHQLRRNQLALKRQDPEKIVLTLSFFL